MGSMRRELNIIEVPQYRRSASSAGSQPQYRRSAGSAGSQQQRRQSERVREERRRRTMNKKRRRLRIRVGILSVLSILFFQVLTGGQVLPDKLVSFARQLIEEDGNKVNQNKSDFLLQADTDIYPPVLLEALENNPELADFVAGYPESDGSVTGGLTGEELNESFPLLLQWDKRWGYAPYGADNIALSGCAPACLSMVAVALTRNPAATPDAVADYATAQGYYEKGSGTKWSIMTDGCQQFGIQGTEVALDQNKVMTLLEEGTPIICSMRPGDFTTTGHFIVLVGTEDGKIRVNDPYSRIRSNNLWEYSTLEYQIKNLWSFTAL